MAVTPDDVRHVATLARIGVPEARVAGLVAEINGILAHMAVLTKVDTSAIAGGAGPAEAGGIPLAPDEPPSVPLVRAREEFAPETRDGFFLVPRLATHDDAGSSA